MNNLNVNGTTNIQSSSTKNNYNKNVDRSLEFSRILSSIQNSNELKVSGHAQDRMKERNIRLSSADMNNLNGAAQKIREKGGREAVILYHDVAFLTSIKNNTIITAIDKDNLKNNVFTNIDSTLIL